MAPQNKQCAAITRNGARCNKFVSNDNDTNDFCWSHSPENSAKRRDNAAKAGKAHTNKMSEIAETRAYIWSLVERVLSRQLNPQVARTAGALIKLWLETYSFENEQQNFEKLAPQLQALLELHDQEMQKERPAVGLGLRNVRSS